MAEEHLHWADQIALEIKERTENDPELKKMVKEHGYIIYDEKTPSGEIHVGSGRGWLIHDVVAKAMRTAGMNAKFILSADDIDPYDKPNKDLPRDWDKYIGMPFRNMPSPVEGYKSFADYFFMKCVEKFSELGIEADIESTGEQYENGSFNPAIKTILDNQEKVKSIFARLYGEDNPSAHRIPFNVICEKCGKIATTAATDWDSKNEMLSYECRDDVVEWAKGCGHKGTISPYNGNGKFPWKVEWAAKWPTKKVICEFAGKDHFTKGGSRTAAVAIADEVLNFMPPYPSDRKRTGKGYEFFNIGGKKMSTSKGQGMSFVEAATLMPPKILRFLLVRTRPNAVLDFDPNRDNDIIFLFDRYDETERIYYGAQELPNEKELQKQKRVYELSQTGELHARLPLQIPFRLAATVIQVGITEEGALELLKKSGHAPEDIEGMDIHNVLERLRDAKAWIENFASEQYKFELQEKIELQVEPKMKDLLKAVLKEIEEKDWEAKALHDRFYELCESFGVEPKEYFTTAYRILINKDRGPQLANFLLMLGKDRVKKLFDQI